jgi:hypothetical protein
MIHKLTAIRAWSDKTRNVIIKVNTKRGDKQCA